jgi:hypothetical protein
MAHIEPVAVFRQLVQHDSLLADVDALAQALLLREQIVEDSDGFFLEKPLAPKFVHFLWFFIVEFLIW